MIRQWHILRPDPGKVERLSRAIGCHPVTAAVLLNRGVDSAEGARALRDASLQQLRSPLGLKDMGAAAERIAKAVFERERILVYGDYDVDGVTATALLLSFLRAAGADAGSYIPDRAAEGYGMKPAFIGDYAVRKGVRLIITADCGANEHETAAAARRAGIDMVITDHHQIGMPVPPAAAVVNPKRTDCTAGFEHLAGVGVAFCLAVALRKELREAGFWRDMPEPNLRHSADLVALGTVADIVPLIGENRIMTRIGLDLINANRRPGLHALRRTAGILDSPVDSEDIAFRLAPRLNAAGRIGHAAPALELLLTENPDRAATIAEALEAQNAERQRLERQVISDVLARLQADPALLQPRVLVMADEAWHEGILGIAASKIGKQFYRPVVLLKTAAGIGKGSARSIEGVDMCAALASCREWLDTFGGHAQAAGLRLPADNIDRFRTALDEQVRKAAAPNTFIPKITLDSELDFKEISADLLDELETLKPYGAGHPEPLFVAHRVKVAFSKEVGGRHRRLVLSQEPASGRRIAAIHFNPERRAARATHFERIAFRLRWNVWNGRRSLQLTVEEAQPAPPAAPGQG